MFFQRDRAPVLARQRPKAHVDRGIERDGPGRKIGDRPAVPGQVAGQTLLQTPAAILFDQVGKLRVVRRRARRQQPTELEPVIDAHPGGALLSARR
ncbi:MAG TPA: hypothetical protein PKE29_01045 [Phycisphaerales bacterium]|nr:hypothetical protein [Phycisphaerales bacterium]